MKKLNSSWKWASLPVIVAILPSMLSVQAFTSRCGSVKVSVGVEGWSVEAHKCPLESSSSRL